MDQALNMILSPAVKKAFDLSQESEKTKEAYGRHGLGQSVLLARRLVESGARFVTASGDKYNAWDTHGRGAGGENDKEHRDKLVPPSIRLFPLCWRIWGRGDCWSRP